MLSMGGVKMEQSQSSAQRCLVARQEYVKGMLFGQLSNGGGSIPLGREYTLGFVALDDRRIVLQLFRNAIGAPVAYQTWQKAKMVAPPKPTKLNLNIESAQGELI